MATRTQARVAVVQLLYAIDLGNTDMQKKIDEYLLERKIKSTKAEFAKSLFNGVLQNLETIDKVIKEHLNKDWPFERLDNVDKAILRLGVYEILFTDLAYQVIINEAVEIAKLLSNDKSMRFVNGMLDRIAKEVRK
ncbi:MAG: transcription antitermination factor NusB [Nautilia sp.]|nr:MAG: transcription antitermination factor NusB [Nautilia sp.]